MEKQIYKYGSFAKNQTARYPLCQVVKIYAMIAQIGAIARPSEIKGSQTLAEVDTKAKTRIRRKCTRGPNSFVCGYKALIYGELTRSCSGRVAARQKAASECFILAEATCTMTRVCQAQPVTFDQALTGK